MAICLDFDWQIDEFMVYCRSTQLREKSMKSYKQALRLFERRCIEEMNIPGVYLWCNQYKRSKNQERFLLLFSICS